MHYLYMSSLVIKFSFLLEHLILMGRNSRWPNKANHGARPCSSVMRRMRREGYYQRPRAEGNAGVDIATDDDEMDAEGGDEELEAEGQEKAAEGGAAAGTGQAGTAGGKEGEKGGKDQKPQGKDAGKGDAGAGKADANKQETGKAIGK